MSQKQQDWLVDYLVSHNFNVEDSDKLIDKITGMTAQDILSAMEKAKVINDRLNSTSLGKELN